MLPVLFQLSTKVNKSNTKYAMRQAAHRHLPDMVAEKKKLGFLFLSESGLKDEKYYNMIKRLSQVKLLKSILTLMRLLNILMTTKKVSR